MIQVRLSRFYAEEAELPWPDDDHPARGEYVISDRALMQTDFDFNFTPQRMTIDAVVDGA